MKRTSYKSVLRAKGIKPIRGATHTKKGDGDIELLPVRGSIVHHKPADNVVRLNLKAIR